MVQAQANGAPSPDYAGVAADFQALAGAILTNDRAAITTDGNKVLHACATLPAAAYKGRGAP